MVFVVHAEITAENYNSCVLGIGLLVCGPRSNEDGNR